MKWLDTCNYKSQCQDLLENLSEAEAKALAKAREVKPMQIPLDKLSLFWTKHEKTGKDILYVAERDKGDGVGTDGKEMEMGTGTGMVRTVMNWGMWINSLGLGMDKMWAPAGAKISVGGSSSREDLNTRLGIAVPNVQTGVENAITLVAHPTNLLQPLTSTNVSQSTVLSSAWAGERPPVAKSLDALKLSHVLYNSIHWWMNTCDHESPIYGNPA
ncbi:hypothetical protein RHS01_09746 [Rhizoctonia solani]|uniref:Uncharacterized protein n=1 Tax=Rhizoctonia solani TaxID=456999 RepID=A0A8H7I6P0_9AGAM|nr:hypothetical protein RHS01_09746 [Rhizoctonia solani]